MSSYFKGKVLAVAVILGLASVGVLTGGGLNGSEIATFLGILVICIGVVYLLLHRKSA